MSKLEEALRESKVTWMIHRYKDEYEFKHNRVYDFSMFDGNIMLNEGINELWTLVCGTGATKFDNSNAYLGVGDSSTAALATQTGLQATTNKYYKLVDSGYPTYGSSQKATWRAIFGVSEANYSWNEFSIANGSSDSSKNLNRKVSSEGTKISGQVWVLTLSITLA